MCKRAQEFHSVDPLAQQYPAWSTYHYVFNNPLLFVDPTGAIIEIAVNGFRTDENGVRLKDENGNYILGAGTITYQYGMSLTDNAAVNKAIQALDGITNRGLDQHRVIDALIASPSTTLIVPALNWNEQNAHDSSVLWGPKGGLIHEDGNRHSPAVSLLHELGHEYWKQNDPEGRIIEEMNLYNPYNHEGLAKYERDQAIATGGYNGYKGYEEMWVIKTVEHFATRRLGQGQRSSHGKLGKFRAVDLFSTEGSETFIYPENRRH